MAQGFESNDQDRLLDEATAVVKEQAFYMKRAMDSDQLRDALKHASNLICELRTSHLTPKNYYELYMQVFQEMQHLSNFFNDRSRHGRKMMDLYESVQHAGNILPRMYLLSTVGASYIKSKEAPAKEILKDMSELTKGVQHPIRGLFLRYYLSQMVKDKLPDSGTDYEAAGGGDINDAFDFLLTNFMESNRLWVRIQHQGPMKDKAKREKERFDLRVLVGNNLVRLSQLEGMTEEFFKEVALDKLLEHVLSVKDTMSQQYLFECMIQVFPDEFHIATLERALHAYTKAQPSVNMQPIMKTLMDRLTVFLQDNKDNDHALKDVDIFTLFNQHLKTILERTLEPATAGAAAAPDIGPALELQAAFMNFTLKGLHNPEDPSPQVHHIDIILKETSDLVGKYFDKLRESGSPSKDGKLHGAAADKVVDLLAHVMKVMPQNILDMQNANSLIATLNASTRKAVALTMVNSICKEGNLELDSTLTCNQLIDFLNPLLVDGDDTENVDKESDAFKKEQEQVSKLVYKIKPACVDGQYELDEEVDILKCLLTGFGKGGPERLIHTIPAVVNAFLRLAEKKLLERDVPPSRAKAKKIVQSAHGALSKTEDYFPMTAFPLWLSMAVYCDKWSNNDTYLVENTQWQEGEEERVPAHFEPIAEDCLTKALVIFEEHVSSSLTEWGCTQVCGSVLGMKQLQPDTVKRLYINLAEKVNNALKKPVKIHCLLQLAKLSTHPMAPELDPDEGDKSWMKKLDTQAILKKVFGDVNKEVTSSPGNCELWVDVMDAVIALYHYDAYEPTPQNPANWAIDAKGRPTLIHISYSLSNSTIDYGVKSDDGNAAVKEKSQKALAHWESSVAYMKCLAKERPEAWGWLNVIDEE